MAMPDDLKTQPVPRVYSFDRETLQKIVGDPHAFISRAMISVWPICGKIAEHARPQATGLSEAAARLEELVEITGRLTLLRCPLCGCFYKRERRPGPGGDTEDVREELTRHQPAEAFELLLGQQAKAILRQGGRWIFTW
jgi:hypothetical protein